MYVCIYIIIHTYVHSCKFHKLYSASKGWKKTLAAWCKVTWLCLESKIPAISSYEDPVVCFLSKKEGAAAVGYNLKQRAQMAWNMGPSGNSSAFTGASHWIAVHLEGSRHVLAGRRALLSDLNIPRLGAWKRWSDLESGVILSSYLNLLFLSARSVLRVECHHEIDGNSPWDVGSLPPFGHVWGLVWLLQICKKKHCKLR